MFKITTYLVFCGLLLASCGTKEKATVNKDGKDLPFRKVVREQDPELKFKYAEVYFTNEDYYKAMTLYEELIPLWRLTDKGRTCYYKYAECHYRMADFYLAGYYFKQFNKNNISDPRAEEALFKSALCKVRNSPDYSLDQGETEKALEQLQLFLNRYPDSKFKDSSNNIIDRLTNKLDKKQFEVAMLYYKTENYKSATAMFDVCIEKFPQSNYKELILFHKMKAFYRLASNSIPTKKVKRFEETSKSYYNFVAAFPESVMKKEAEQIFKDTQKNLDQLK